MKKKTGVISGILLLLCVAIVSYAQNAESPISKEAEKKYAESLQKFAKEVIDNYRAALKGTPQKTQGDVGTLLEVPAQAVPVTEAAPVAPAAPAVQAFPPQAPAPAPQPQPAPSINPYR